MTLTLQKVTIKINENRTFYLLERNVIRMKRRIQALTLALCFCTAFLFSSCSFMQKQEEPQVQNHSELTSTESFPIKLNVGEEEYLIASKPRSLAVLSADLVQALGDIGAASLISGACTDAPSSVSLSASQSCGTALNPNLQQLISVRPDWVLVSVPMRQSSIEQLEQAGIQVICFDYPDSIDSIKERYRTLFSLCYGLEGTQKAEAFLNEYQQRLDTAIQPASEYVRVTSKKKAIYLAQPDYTMATGETLEGELLDQMGFNNLGELGSRWSYPEVESEELVPDIIFYDNQLDPEQIIQSPVYSQSPAVLSQQLIPVDFSAMRLHGLPMIDQLAQMAQSGYPQAYGG